MLSETNEQEPLFRKDSSYSNRGLDLTAKMEKYADSIFEDNKDVCPRILSHLLVRSIMDSEMTFVFKKRFRKLKDKKKEHKDAF